MKELHSADATRPDEMVEKTLTFQIVEDGQAIHTLARVSFAYSPMMSAETCTEMETLVYDLASKARRIILSAPRE
ncbi:MAG: hypothetical protein WC163_11545 [Sulfurovum sp.]